MITYFRRRELQRLNSIRSGKVSRDTDHDCSPNLHELEYGEDVVLLKR